MRTIKNLLTIVLVFNFSMPLYAQEQHPLGEQLGKAQRASWKRELNRTWNLGQVQDHLLGIYRDEKNEAAIRQYFKTANLTQKLTISGVEFNDEGFEAKIDAKTYNFSIDKKREFISYDGVNFSLRSKGFNELKAACESWAKSVESASILEWVVPSAHAAPPLALWGLIAIVGTIYGAKVTGYPRLLDVDKIDSLHSQLEGFVDQCKREIAEQVSFEKSETVVLMGELDETLNAYTGDEANCIKTLRKHAGYAFFDRPYARICKAARELASCYSQLKARIPKPASYQSPTFR